MQGAINIKVMNCLVRFYSPALVIALLAIGSPACGKSDSADSGGATAQVSALERGAQDLALAEVMKHWSKAPDGWITARNTGSSFAPIEFLRQVREFTVEGVREYDLSDSDRLNGFEWAGEVSFKQTPCREAGDQGIVLDGMAGISVFRQRGRWSQWIEFQPEAVKIQKVKGKWQVHEDTWLLRGKIPGPQDFANASVK